MNPNRAHESSERVWGEKKKAKAVKKTEGELQKGKVDGEAPGERKKEQKRGKSSGTISGGPTFERGQGGNSRTGFIGKVTEEKPPSRGGSPCQLWRES